MSTNNCLILALLSFTFLFSHNFSARPDSLQDTLGIASIYYFLTLVKNGYRGLRENLYLVAIVLITALSVFTKQSGIQFIIIFGGFFLINGNWRYLIKFSFLSFVIYGGFLFLFRLMYHSFFDNVIGGVANGLNIENFINYVITKNIFILTVWPLVLLIIFLLIKNNSLFKGKPEERALSICALGTLIFASATALKMGSTVQYYIVFANIGLLMIMKYLAFKNFSFYAYFAIIILTFAAQDIKLLITFDNNPVLENQRIASKKVAAYIENDRTKNSGRYIFSNLTTDYAIPSRQSINNIFYRDCLIPQMDILEYSTGPSKVIDYRKFAEMLQSGEVEYIIDSKPKSNFSILDNMDDIKKTNFNLVEEIDGYLIYKSLLN